MPGHGISGLNSFMDLPPATRDACLETVRCDLCGADSTDLVFQGKDRLYGLPGTFPVVICRECHLVYVNPRPGAEALAAYYPTDYTPYHRKPGCIGRAKAVLRRREARRIGKLLPAGARVLEVGCAAGDLLAPLRERGLQVTGVEMSPYAAGIAREQHGLDVHTGTIFDCPCAEGSFDAVVMRHVLEHFPSPRKALEKAAALLKDEGLLFITTPNYDSADRKLFGAYWYAFDTPRHLYVFSIRTIRKMLEAAGFGLAGVSHGCVPNNWIGSVRNFVEERRSSSFLVKGLSINNPLCILLFAPVSILFGIFGRSGIVEITAKKIR